MRQCTLACDSDERALKYVADYLQGDHLVWNSDYPHPDAPEPAAQNFLDFSTCATANCAFPECAFLSTLGGDF